MTRTRATPYSHALVKAVSDVIAQDDHPGLEGAEIDWILSRVGIGFRPAGYSKPAGLCVVLFTAQLNNPGLVITFIARAMESERHVAHPGRFAALHRRLAQALSPFGLTLDAAGAVRARRSCSDDSCPVREVDRGLTGADAQLAVQAARRGLHGVSTHEQLVGDGLQRGLRRQVDQHLALASRE